MSNIHYACVIINDIITEEIKVGKLPVIVVNSESVGKEIRSIYNINYNVKKVVIKLLNTAVIRSPKIKSEQ
jgi:hypothetical protein